MKQIEPIRSMTGEAEVQIRIPENGGDVSAAQVQKEASEKFKSIDTLIYAVVVAIVVSSIASLISVGAIVIDQLHFNNQTYRSQTEFEKQNLEVLKEINSLKTDIEILKQRK